MVKYMFFDNGTYLVWRWFYTTKHGRYYREFSLYKPDGDWETQPITKLK